MSDLSAFSKDSYGLSRTPEYKNVKKKDGDTRYVPRCPDCGSEGVFVMEGLGMCGSTPGWTYKYKRNPTAGATKIVNGDFVREAEWLYEDRKGNHK